MCVLQHTASARRQGWVEPEPCEAMWSHIQRGVFDWFCTIVLGVGAQIHEALLFAGGQNTTSAERLSQWCQSYPVFATICNSYLRVTLTQSQAKKILSAKHEKHVLRFRCFFNLT